jgi:hypothetical protein
MKETLPSEFKKIIVKKISPNFNEATEIVLTKLPKTKPNEGIKNFNISINKK